MIQNSTNAGYVVFVGPVDAEADLEPMKIYRLVAGEPSDPEDYLRVVDESGDDYLYPKRLFEPITVPNRVAQVLDAGP